MINIILKKIYLNSSDAILYKLFLHTGHVWSARVFAVNVFNIHLIKFFHHDLTIVIGDIFLTAHGYPE